MIIQVGRDLPFSILKEQLSGMSTNNLEAERHLAGFDKQAPVSKYINKKFTAKEFRNNCFLFY